MANKAVTLICTAATKAQADALAATFPGGAGTFSVRLTTTQGGQVPTHYAGSGYVPQAMADAFELSVDPFYKVFPLAGSSFAQHLAECEPPLFRVVDVL